MLLVLRHAVAPPAGERLSRTARSSPPRSTRAVGQGPVAAVADVSSAAFATRRASPRRHRRSAGADLHTRRHSERGHGGSWPARQTGRRPRGDTCLSPGPGEWRRVDGGDARLVRRLSAMSTTEARTTGPSVGRGPGRATVAMAPKRARAPRRGPTDNRRTDQIAPCRNSCVSVPGPKGRSHKLSLWMERERQTHAMSRKPVIVVVPLAVVSIAFFA